MQVERLRREHDELIRSALEKEAEWSELDDRLADLEMENAGLAEVGTRPLSALPSSSNVSLNAALELDKHNWMVETRHARGPNEAPKNK